jgi:hypothetical protein
VSEHPLDRDHLSKLVSTIFADDLHAKRIDRIAGFGARLTSYRDTTEPGTMTNHGNLRTGSLTGKRDETAGWPRGWAEHRRAQTPGARLTPAERLRWLEETMATMRRWVGRAAAPNRNPSPPPVQASDR